MTITTHERIYPGKILRLLITSLHCLCLHPECVWHFFYQFFKTFWKLKLSFSTQLDFPDSNDIICRIVVCKIAESCSLPKPSSSSLTCLGWQQELSDEKWIGTHWELRSHVNHILPSTGCISSSQTSPRYNGICKWIFDANKILSLLRISRHHAEWKLKSRLDASDKSACIIKLSLVLVCIVIVFQIWGLSSSDRLCQHIYSNTMDDDIVEFDERMTTTGWDGRECCSSRERT